MQPTRDQQKLLSRITHPVQKWAIRAAIARGRKIPDPAWHPIPQNLEQAKALSRVESSFKILYGRFGEESVFIPLASVEWASWLSKVGNLVYSGLVKSWSELKDSVPLDVYQDIVEIAEPGADPECELDDAALLDWRDRMDWLEPLDWESFAVDDEPSAVKAFEDLGYECVRDDDRIWSCFWWC